MYHMQQVVVGGVVKGVELAEVIQWDETVNTYTRQFIKGPFKCMCVWRGGGECVCPCVHAHVCATN